MLAKVAALVINTNDINPSINSTATGAKPSQCKMAALTAPRNYAPAKIQLELPNQPCALAWVGDALVAATYDYVEAEGARVLRL